MCQKLPENLEFFYSLQRKYKYYPECNYKYALLTLCAIGFALWILT